MKHEILPDFPRPLVFAHRGASSLAPENTAAAFGKARELGCPGVELDVHLCKTGELVVIHDNTMKRTGQNDCGKNDERKIEELTFGELRDYDIGIWFGQEFAGERIITLDETLDILGDDRYVDIEIKTESLRCGDVCRKTAEILNARGGAGRFIVSSFNPLAVCGFKKYSSIPTALIYADAPDVPLPLRRGEGRLICAPDALKPCWKDLRLDEAVRRKTDHYAGSHRNEARADAAHSDERGDGHPDTLPNTASRKRPYFVWTVDDRNVAAAVIARGAQGVITNRPQDILDEFPGSRVAS